MFITINSAKTRLNKCSAVMLLLTPVFYFSQKNDSLKFRDIEMVRIIKTQNFDKNRSKINTTQTDLLNHDAGKFLNTIPEISGVKKAGNYATDPVLRGFKYEQLNIVSDGIATAVNACPSRMDPAVSQVNMNTVQEAEIFKGPYHFRHGSAIGGTINFVSALPKFIEVPKFGGRISTGFESNGNILRNEAFTEISSKKIVFDLFGSYQKGDRYKDADGTEVRSAFLRYNIGAKMAYKWNENNVSSFQVTTNQGRNVEFAALTMDLLYDKTWMYQFKHTTKFNNFFFDHLEISAYRADVDHSMGTPDLKMVSNVKSASEGARAELKKAWLSNIFYTGIDYHHDDVRNISTLMPMMPGMKMRDGTSWQNSGISQTGWFAEYQKLFTSAKFTASARVDYNSGEAKEPSMLFQKLYGNTNSKDINLSVSAGYSQKISDDSQLALWLGRAQRSGSLTERFINLFPVGNDAYEILGNPLLKPETNNQADLIYTLSLEKLYFQTDVFYSLMENYISGVIRKDIMPSSMSSPGVRQMQNTGKAMRTGFESRLSWQFLPKFHSEMAVAYTYGEDLTSKIPLAEIYPMDFRWKIEGTFNKLIAGINYRFAARQNRINPNFGEKQTPDFSVFGVNAKYEIFSKAFLNAEISNIFNREYTEHLNRSLPKNPNLRIMERGRSFNFGFSYNF